MRYYFSRKELETKKAAAFQDGDIVRVGKYRICIHWGASRLYPTKTYVEIADTCKSLDCTPGTKNGWPYYIAAFITRH